MLLDDFRALTGVDLKHYLDAATAGGVVGGTLPISGGLPGGERTVAVAGLILAARLAPYLELDAAVRKAAAENEAADAGGEPAILPNPVREPADGDGVVVSIPVGLLRQAARVLAFGRAQFGGIG